MQSPAYGLKSPEFEGQSSSSTRDPVVGLKKEPMAPPPPPVIPPLTPTFTPGIDKPAVSHVIWSCDLPTSHVTSYSRL